MSNSPILCHFILIKNLTEKTLMLSQLGILYLFMFEVRRSCDFDSANERFVIYFLILMLPVKCPVAEESSIFDTVAYGHKMNFNTHLNFTSIYHCGNHSCWIILFIMTSICG